jgi:NADPH:quinone reductase-like Zn-dependent oxidoreductase
MHAVAITGFGTTPELMQLPVPQPGPGEVLLRIRAAAMNPFDWKVVDGPCATWPRTHFRSSWATTRRACSSKPDRE